MEINDFTMTSTLSKVNSNSIYYKIKKFIIGNKKKNTKILKQKN